MKPLEPLSRMGVHTGVLRTGWKAACSILEAAVGGSAAVLQIRKSLFARQALTIRLWGNGMTPSCVWRVSKEWHQKAHPQGPPKVLSVPIVTQSITHS